jgi:ABC-2 type transport system permease protein
VLSACQAAGPGQVPASGIYLGQAVIAVLAVMTVSGEYSTGMIRLTLTAMPRRVTVLAAKAAVLTGLVLVTGTIAVLGSLLAGRLILPGHGIGPPHGYPAISPGDGPVLRAACGSVLYFALIALLSVGAATALREAAAAIGVVLGLLYLFPIIAAVTGNPDLARHIQQIADDGRAGHPGHHRPEQPAHQPLGRPWRARRLGRGRAAVRGTAATSARRISQRLRQARPPAQR